MKINQSTWWLLVGPMDDCWFKKMMSWLSSSSSRSSWLSSSSSRSMFFVFWLLCRTYDALVGRFVHAQPHLCSKPTNQRTVEFYTAMIVGLWLLVTTFVNYDQTFEKKAGWSDDVAKILTSENNPRNGNQTSD